MVNQTSEKKHKRQIRAGIDELLQYLNMKFWCRHWYDVGIVVAMIAGIFLILEWNGMPILQRVELMSFMAILIHQFEEYRFPGGEPAIMNIVLQGSKKPDRYPLNQFSAMLTNCLFTYIIYLLPVFFYDIIWLGMAPILMGVMQFPIHGVMTNKKLKTIYNPGLGAVVCIQIPLAVYYFQYIATNNLASGSTWTYGIIYTVLSTVIVLGLLTYIILPDEHTKWVFAPEELERFHVREKVEKKGIDTKESPLGNMLKKIKKAGD